MEIDKLNPLGIKVGDKVRGYFAGIWEVVAITTNHYGQSPSTEYRIIVGRKLLDKELKPVKKSEQKEWGMDWTKPFGKKELNRELQEVKSRYKEAERILFGG